MTSLTVLIAAGAAFVFGAIWYMVLAKPWATAVGITQETTQKQGVKPFIIAAICLILVAGMMRHAFALSGIDDMAKGFLSGLGIGIFMVCPWIATNYAYSNRPRNLTLIDGGYAIGGCSIIGFILTAF